MTSEQTPNPAVDSSAGFRQVPDDERMTGAELRTISEFLGLDQQNLAQLLNVSDRSIRKWLTGKTPIPDGVRETVEQWEAETGRVIGELVERLLTDPDPEISVWATTEAYHQDIPGATMPARWWRHVVARVALEIPGLVISEA